MSHSNTCSQHWMYSCDCHSSHVHMGTDTNPSAPVITKEKVFSSSEPLLDWSLLLGMWRFVLDLYCILISGQQGFSTWPYGQIIQKQLKFQDEEGHFYSILCNCYISAFKVLISVYRSASWTPCSAVIWGLSLSNLICLCSGSCCR